MVFPSDDNPPPAPNAANFDGPVEHKEGLMYLLMTFVKLKEKLGGFHEPLVGSAAQKLRLLVEQAVGQAEGNLPAAQGADETLLTKLLTKLRALRQRGGLR